MTKDETFDTIKESFWYWAEDVARDIKNGTSHPEFRKKTAELAVILLAMRVGK